MGFNVNFSFGWGKSVKAAPEKESQPAAVSAAVVSEPSPQQINEAEFERVYGDIIRKVFQEEEQKYAAMSNKVDDTTNNVMAPIASGRVSLYEGNYGFGNMNAPVDNEFDYTILKTLQKYAFQDRHVSMAVENIVALGNTDYDIDFGETGEKQSVEMRKYLQTRVKSWYEFASGEDSLDNDLLTQMAYSGALSAEAVIMPNLKGIQSIVRVDPYYIRFGYDKVKSVHVPLQQIVGVNSNNGTGLYPGYIQLNPATYTYLGIRRLGISPVAVPPFASALEDLLTEKDMIGNFKNMMRRLGMMGFLSVLLKAPPQQQKSPEEYENYLRNYLNSVRQDVENGFSRGFTVGYKDNHEFTLQGSELNGASGEQLMKMVKSLIYSGLKQDPNMHGENYATTETFGRVVLTKMTQQVANFQRTLAEFKSRVFMLELRLAGFRPAVCNIRYKRASITDELKDEQAKKERIENAARYYFSGFMSQKAAANYAGVDDPELDAPITNILPSKAVGGSEDNKAQTTAEKKLDRIRKKLNIEAPPFDYAVPEDCSGAASFDEIGNYHDAHLVDFLKAYLGAVNTQFETFVNKSKKSITREFKALGETALVGEVQAAMYYGLLEGWENNFVTPVHDIVTNNIEDIYSFYRQDKSIFSESSEYSRSPVSFVTVPDAAFNLLDARAIAFLEEVDHTYLGKFITDPDTQERIVNWVKQKFEQGDVPIGKGSSLIQEFILEFAREVLLEAWKIRRIIETTSNKARNIGNLLYLNQADIAEYQVVEVMDRLTCGYCKHMNGKIFSVKNSVQQYETLFREGIAKTPEYTPFATTIKLDQFVTMDPKSLQAKGIALPSYHPHCRGRCIAYFKAV